MAISVQRCPSIDPQVMIRAGSNDHLQSRGLLARLTDGSVLSNEVMGEAVMTLFSALTEVQIAVQQRLKRNAIKIVFVLSPGYAALPEPLQFVYAMVTTIAEGRFDVIVPAPNRSVDHDITILFALNFLLSGRTFQTPSRGLKSIAQLVWCWTKSFVGAVQLRLVVKLRPGTDENHVLVHQMANDLWFRQINYVTNAQERIDRRNLTSLEEDLMALALRTKPHTNSWLYLSPRLCILGENAFEHSPAVIKEIHVHLKNLLIERELPGGKMLQLRQDVNTMSLDKFQSDVLTTKAQYERSGAILGGMGVGWTPSFLSTCYPRASRNLIASFVKDIRNCRLA